MTSIAKHVPVSVRLRLELASVSLQSPDNQQYVKPATVLDRARDPVTRMTSHLRSWDSRLSALRSFWTCSAQMSYTGDALSTCASARAKNVSMHDIEMNGKEPAASDVGSQLATRKKKMVKKTERPTSVLVALHSAMAGREAGRGSKRLAARTSSMPSRTYKGSVKPVQVQPNAFTPFHCCYDGW